MKKILVILIMLHIVCLFAGCSPAALPAASQTVLPNVLPASSAPAETAAPTVKITGVFSGFYSDSYFELRSDGDLWAWGENGSGQLGDGTSKSRWASQSLTINSQEVDLFKGMHPSAAKKVMGGVKQVSAGISHTLILKQDGTLWGCGSNKYYQLGVSTEGNITKPVKIMDNVKQVSAGCWHTLVLKQDGSLWSFGCNSCGQLGVKKGKSTPQKVMDGVSYTAAGAEYSMAVKEDGTLWAWGDNETGQLGDGTTKSRSKPKKIIDGVVFAAAGAHGEVQKEKNMYQYMPGHSVNIWKHKKWGTKWVPGYKIKIGVNTYSNISGSTSYALKTDGTLWAWGQNDCGQTGAKESSKVPALITSGVSSLSAGSGYALVIKEDGSLWTYGSISITEGDVLVRDGILYRTYNSTETQPGMQKSMDEALSAACGKSEALIIKSDGSLCCNYHPYSGIITTINPNAMFNLGLLPKGME